MLRDPKRLRTRAGYGYLVGRKDRFRLRGRQNDSTELVGRILEDPANVQALRAGIGRSDASKEELAEWLITGLVGGGFHLLRTRVKTPVMDRPAETSLFDLAPSHARPRMDAQPLRPCSHCGPWTKSAKDWTGSRGFCLANFLPDKLIAATVRNPRSNSPLGKGITVIDLAAAFRADPANRKSLVLDAYLSAAAGPKTAQALLTALERPSKRADIRTHYIEVHHVYPDVSISQEDSRTQKLKNI